MGMGSVSRFVYLPATTTLAASFNAAPINLEYMKGYSLSVIITGTGTGSVKLQLSDDIASNPQGTGIVNWIDIAGTSTALVGAAINISYQASNVYYAWLRLVFARTGGAGTIYTAVTTKGY